MSNLIKDLFKRNFLNYKTGVIVLFFIILIILSIYHSFFIYPLVLIIIIIIMSLISFIKEVKSLKEIYEYKDGVRKFTYRPISINTKDFINIIESYGLPLTYIKIDNIYALEVIKDGENYTCYIDENEFSSLKDFYNYRMDNKTIKELDKIKILSFDDREPKEIKHID